MSIIVTVKTHPGAHKEKITVHGPQVLEIWVRQKPEQGAANEMVCALVAQHFNMPRKNVLLIRGGKTHHKVLKVIT